MIFTVILGVYKEGLPSLCEASGPVFVNIHEIKQVRCGCAVIDKDNGDLVGDCYKFRVGEECQRFIKALRTDLRKHRKAIKRNGKGNQELGREEHYGAFLMLMIFGRRRKRLVIARSMRTERASACSRIQHPIIIRLPSLGRACVSGV